MQEKKILILLRVPPGDRWKYVDDSDAGIFSSLTDGLEFAFQKS